VTGTKLERYAIAAHRLNWTWDRFWQMHGEAVRQAEPYDRAKFAKLVARVLALVTSGDLDGQMAVGDDVPWETDDCLPQAPPDDTTTAARIDWAAAGIGQEASP
jgi:hypothetical protein